MGKNSTVEKKIEGGNDCHSWIKLVREKKPAVTPYSPGFEESQRKRDVIGGLILEVAISSHRSEMWMVPVIQSGKNWERGRQG